MRKKIIGIFVCMLMVWLIFSCMNGIAVEHDTRMMVPSRISEMIYDDILFSDDFNDGIKDTSKWTEIYANGIWQEINGRAEFQLMESGGTGSRSEGIQSKAIATMIGGDEPWDNRVKVTWRMYPTIDATSSEGKVVMKITEGRNYIVVEYDRTAGVARFSDSLGNEEVCIGGDDPWENSLRISGDRYFVTLNMQSFTVFAPIFSSGPVTLRIQFFIELGGSTRTNYLRSGFDDIILSQLGADQPPDAPSCVYDKIKDQLVVTAIDRDEDQIRYGVSWDNNGMVDQWTGFIPSGTSQTIDCNGRKGTVGVIAADEYGAQSSWVSVKSIKQVSQQVSLQVFETLFQRFPNTFPLLRQLIGGK